MRGARRKMRMTTTKRMTTRKKKRNARGRKRRNDNRFAATEGSLLQCTPHAPREDLSLHAEREEYTKCRSYAGDRYALLPPLRYRPIRRLHPATRTRPADRIQTGPGHRET